MNTELTEIIKDSEVIKPDQPQDTSEGARVMAEAQAAMAVAAARPRHQIAAIERIKVSCERPRMAAGSAYEYSKGGQPIMGASIRLLECVAQNWGNIQWGFRELERQGKSSKVEAYAIDLETNSKVVRIFIVPHEIATRGGKRVLTDPRDIYELIANHAQRRVRTCLENVIPRDIVEDAMDICQQTLRANVDLAPERLKAMLEAFAKHGVSKDQIEEKFQRKFSAISPAQFMSMQRIYQTLADGMSEVADHFKIAEDEPATDLKTKLEKKVSGKKNTSGETPGSDNAKV